MLRILMLKSQSSSSSQDAANASPEAQDTTFNPPSPDPSPRASSPSSPASRSDFASIAKSLGAAVAAHSIGEHDDDSSEASLDLDDEYWPPHLRRPHPTRQARRKIVWHTPPLSIVRCSTTTLLATMLFLLCLAVILPTCIGTSKLKIVLPIASAVYVISIIEWRFLRSHCTLARSREARHQALNDATAAYGKTSEIIDLRGTNTNVIEQIVDGDIDDGDIEEGSLAL